MCNRTTTIAAVIATASIVSSCAGRDARPVAISQPQDSSMACAQIQSEIAGNNKTISELGSEKGGKVAQNVAAGVVGLFVWPVLFAMDFKGAASTDQAALEARNQYLATMATPERCGTQLAVKQPVRLAPVAVVARQPANFVARPITAGGTPSQTSARMQPPPVVTFTYASDATNPEQSDDFDTMIDRVATGQQGN